LSRHLAIGDIHGCATALSTLIDFIEPDAEDVIVTLGDHIDRGPDSRGVIEIILDLAKSRQIVSLRGNHEIMMLDARDSESWLRPWLGYGGEQTLASYGGTFEDIPAVHLDFLENTLLPHYETDSHFFVHANARADLPLNQQPDSARYWQKFRDPAAHMSGKTMVCGHTPQASGVPVSNDHAICIDTKVYAEDGWLTCLDVDSGTIWQTNEAGEKRSGSI
jgi:serine/threonine protein phosphatase 1